MATKVIKLQDSNDNILIPVTSASYVQMSVEGQVKSVKDVIIENEEVTAAGYNNLNSRVSTLSLLLAKALNRIDELEKQVSELEKTKINDPELI